MSYDVPRMAGDHEVDVTASTGAGHPLWEIFVRASRGLNHVHVGSLHAPDAETATQHARDVYTRRQEGVSIWVVKSTEIHASDPHDEDAWFDSEKPYRHPTFYEIPDEVGHM
jgi:ring-1,2-phenylacetyl-CoA epoxidase subunit PaaB